MIVVRLLELLENILVFVIKPASFWPYFEVSIFPFLDYLSVKGEEIKDSERP